MRKYNPVTVKFVVKIYFHLFYTVGLCMNCVLDGAVLKYKIKAPFDKLLSCTNYKKWKDIAMENLEEFEKIS